MKISEATRIVFDIDSDKYSENEKGCAIYLVMCMPTHNSITKATLLKVIRYLWNMAFEWKAADKEHSLPEKQEGGE